jgi:glutathione S-transferase
MSESPRVMVFAGLGINGSADLSPACLKLKTYLRMAGIPYAESLGDPRKGPTKKVPYITLDGVTVGDSGLIIEHLKKTFGDPLDAKLTSEERALGHLVRRTVEESLYWCLVHARWTDDAVWPEFSSHFRRVLPKGLAFLLLPMLRKQTFKSLWAQGLSRHTPQDVKAYGYADLSALSRFLGNKSYLFGDAPSSFDASLYGVLANILAFPPEGHLARQLRSHDNLLAFVERVTATWWTP